MFSMSRSPENIAHWKGDLLFDVIDTTYPYVPWRCGIADALSVRVDRARVVVIGMVGSSARGDEVRESLWRC